MKILILIFLISINFSFAQSKDRKISLWYNYGTVPIGKKDLVTSSESIDFIQTEKGDYMIVKYNQTKPGKLKNGGKPGRSSIAGEVAYRNPPKVEGIGLPLISQNIIDNWISALDINKNDFKDSTIKQFLSIPTKDEIVDIAKKTDHIWKLQGKYSYEKNKLDLEKLFKEIAGYKYLEELMKNNIVEENDTLPKYHVHEYESLRISITSSNDEKNFFINFKYPLGQPIINGYYQRPSSKRTYNFGVNTNAINFLPEDSYIKKAFEGNNLKMNYIKWFLETKI